MPAGGAAGQIARLQRVLVVTIGAAVLGNSGLLLWRGEPGWALVLLLLLPVVHAAALGLEFAWMLGVNRADPAPPAGAGAAVRAWLLECVDATRVFGLWQPFYSRREPDCLHGARAPSPPGVLLIHGFFCNRGIWLRWLRRLKAAGVPVATADLEPAFGPIDDYAPLIESAIRRLELATGQAPIVVAHSMGGLALRHWWALPGNSARIRHAITIGSPHQGTWLARLALTPNAAQMRERSPWLRALELRETPATRARLTCFYGHCDNIVFPASHATLPGADNRHLPRVGHISMVEHPEPFEALRELLAADGPPPQSDGGVSSSPAPRAASDPAPCSRTGP